MKPPPAGVAGELNDGVPAPKGCKGCGVPNDGWGAAPNDGWGAAPNEGVEGAPKLGCAAPPPPKLKDGLAGVDGAPNTLLLDDDDVDDAVKNEKTEIKWKSE